MLTVRVHSGPREVLDQHDSHIRKQGCEGKVLKNDGIATVIDEQEKEKSGTRYKEVITLLLFPLP